MSEISERPLSQTATESILANSTLLVQQTIPEPPKDSRSYLDRAIDKVASTVVEDKATREQVTHYTGEILKNAALFSRGKVGVASVVLAYGLDSANPDTSFKTQVLDATLGTAKGVALNTLFNRISGNFSNAPMKGVMMGMTSRTSEIVFDKNAYANPELAAARLKAELINPQMWVFDAATFVGAEGLFRGANHLTGGALKRSYLARGSMMGGSFGFVNGGAGELVRQQMAGEELNVGKILKQGSIDGAVGIAGGALGISASDPWMRVRMKHGIQDAATKVFDKAFPRPPEERHVSVDFKTAIAKMAAVGKAPFTYIKPDGVAERPVATSETVPVGKKISLYAMSPLLIVGNPKDVDSPGSRQAWAAFEKDMRLAKQLGLEGTSVDVWWGLIEPKKGVFDMEYYDRLVSRIDANKLKMAAIMSMHQAGGNVGDNVNVPLPKWVWEHVASQGKFGPDAGKFKSEQGNLSPEYVAFWSTPQVIDRYKAVWGEFQRHFADKKGMISEINISLGPAGELRYPAYNSHDSNSGYPSRGALQIYSEPARAALRDYMLKKYGSEEAVKAAWGQEYGDGIAPPKNPQQFFEQGKHHNTQYGRDLMDFNSDSVIEHGKLSLMTAVQTFGGEKSEFRGIDIGVKFPGVHWRVGEWQNGQVVVGDRLAELAAGLIRTSRGDWGSDEAGRGYRPLIGMVKEVQASSPFSRIVPHFTALEMPDGHEGNKTMPYTLAKWVGQEAQRQGIEIKAENALAHTLYDKASWDRMRSLMTFPGNKEGYYSGITLLRLSDIMNNETARTNFTDLVKTVKGYFPENGQGQ